MPGPLIALATGLGIRNAAKYTYKQLQKLITKAQKKKKTKQTEAEKGYKGKGSKRKQEKVTQRKKPKVDSGLSIEESKKLKKVLDRKEKEWRDLSKKEDEQSMGTPTSSSQLFRLYGKIRK